MSPSSRSRVALAVAAPTALALAVGVGYAAGRGDPSAAPSPVAQRPTAGAPGSAAGTTEGLARPSALSPATSCDDLLAHYVRQGEEVVTAYGWDGLIAAYSAQAGDMRVTSELATRDSATTAKTTRATSSESGTNVQEAGVDEPDVVKTDGERLVRVVDDTLEVHDVTGERPELLGELELAEVREAEILLVDDRVVVIGRDRVERDLQRVLVVDLADAGAPTVVADHTWTGSLLAARLHTGAPERPAAVRLVVAPPLPDLDFRRPGRRLGWREAERLNRELVRRSTIEDWLPRRDGEPLVDCSDVQVPVDDGSPLGTVAISAVDPTDPDEHVSTAIAAGAATAYASADRLYLADVSEAWGWQFDGPMVSSRIAMPLGRDDGVAQVHAFALGGDGGTGSGGLDTTYAASGEVEGAIADRWAMDSVDGVLRVAVGPTQRTANANAVITLREEAGELVEAGRVGGLGRGEDIKSVRWFDDLAIVVTFRQVDPLYTVDLSEPDAPELLGELKIPGFSDYLHPLGSRRLIGLGQATGRWGTSTGAQAALFRVRDLTDTRRLDVVDYPRGSMAGASTDPRQFTWLPERRTALAVVSKGWRGQRGWLSVLRLGDGQLTSELIPVEDGTEVADVRTVPLPSGEVVLVTHDEVGFLDLE